jgi:hypothetical protein
VGNLDVSLLRAVSYPIENTYISGCDRQNHFWTTRGAIENRGLARLLDETAARERGHSVESTPDNAKEAQNQNAAGSRVSTEWVGILEMAQNKETYSVDAFLTTFYRSKTTVYRTAV